MSVVSAKNLAGWVGGQVISSAQVREEFQNIYTQLAGLLDDANIDSISIAKVQGLQDALNTLNTSINNVNNGLSGYLPLSGGTLTGNLTLGAGAEALKVKPGTEDHVYVGLYARTSTPNVRSGYVGYPSVASKDLDVRNELNDPQGHVNLSTVHAQAEVRAKGIRILTRADLPNLYHTSVNTNVIQREIVALPNNHRLRLLTARGSDNVIVKVETDSVETTIFTASGLQRDEKPADVFVNNTSGGTLTYRFFVVVSNSGYGSASAVVEPIPA